jgi:hypothetical protein
VYKLFGGKEWKENTVMTAMFYPGVMGSIFLFINSFVAYYGSSAAASVQEGDHPRAHELDRALNPRPGHPGFSIALRGILPFGAITHRSVNDCALKLPWKQQTIGQRNLNYCFIEHN